jgi:hypothetical protein
MGRIDAVSSHSCIFIRLFTSTFMPLLVWDEFRTSQKKKVFCFFDIGKKCMEKNSKKKNFIFRLFKIMLIPNRTLSGFNPIKKS